VANHEDERIVSPERIAEEVPMSANNKKRVTLDEFDLSDKSARHLARKRGFDVPKQTPGVKAIPLDSLIHVRGPEDCWEWTGAVNRDGYGRYNMDGRGHMAHRLAWVAAGNELPPGMVLMHSCDNPPCCNPAHLSVGTSAENTADKVRKDRHAKGEGIAASILTAEQVIEIRSRYQFRRMTYKMLASEYRVCKDTIQKAVRGIYWRHL
jgi:hypothetical protein